MWQVSGVLQPAGPHVLVCVHSPSEAASGWNEGGDSHLESVEWCGSSPEEI